jgi:WD40 repeat protein
MTSQPPDLPEPESPQPGSDTESKVVTPSISQVVVRLAGVILILIVVARGIIFLVGRETAAAPPAASLSGPAVQATLPAGSGPSLHTSVAPQLAISTANVDRLASLATWGQGALRGAYFAPDGSQFALLTSLDLRLYDAATHQLIQSFPIDEYNAPVAIAPDWQKFVVCEGNILKIFRLKDGHLLTTLQGAPGRESSPAFSPDGSLLASVAMPVGGEVYTGSVELWRLSDGKRLTSWDAGASALAFAPDGKQLATWYAMTGIRVWAVPDGSLLSRIDTSSPNAALFLPDSQTLAAAEMDGKIHRYRAADGSQLDTVPATLPGINSLRLASDGHTLAAQAGDGQVALWRLPDWQPIRNLQIQANPPGVLAFDAHTAQLLSALNSDVALWNLSDGQHKIILSGFYPSERRLAFLAGGMGLASLSGDGMVGTASLQVRSIPDGEIRCGEDSINALSLAASPTAQDGGRIALGSSDGSLILLRASDCVRLKTAKAYRQQVQDVSFDPVDPLLATSSMDTVQVIYYLEPFQMMGLFNTPGGWVTPVRFNHRGDAIAAVSANGKLNVWDYPVGRLLYSLDLGAEGYQASLAFTPDDSQLVSSAHSQILAWRTSDGGQVADWDANGEVQSLAISPDGSLLAVGLADGQIQLRSLADGSLLRSFQAHRGPLTDLAVSPDGRFLASAGQDGTLRLWGVPDVSP